MDVSESVIDGDVPATTVVVSDTAPRQPHSKVQRIESGANEPAVDVPPDSHRDNSAVAEINGCGMNANGGKQLQVDETNAIGCGALRVVVVAPKAKIPTRAYDSAGYDLASAYPEVIPAKGKCEVRTGLRIALPEGTYGRIASRSLHADSHAINVLGGVIDRDYRGPLNFILANHSDEDFKIEEGERVAQLIVERILTPNVVVVDQLEETERGEKRLGSSGKKDMPS
ncbi:hypothetical protein CBR_g21266 [Chara braunii]|uniref:Deoxyuridine 5'-triphosphate nucleotidohydrolase n=1 Tax=Chara braunii TaxID=69332 RepID=A0A388L126_CHABU|nr:hypothetical protein CBR_g21266 [Chara braunii]|eukprot:GBG76026.1 hypothetical protein CBR_g21266 [Chara braunii]